jgi:hypothetical protein
MGMKENDKLHRDIVKGFSSYEVSPASVAYKMLNESKFVNESVIQYIINFIIIHGTRDMDHVPPYLHDTHLVCTELYQVLQKLGMTNAGSRSILSHTS